MLKFNQSASLAKAKLGFSLSWSGMDAAALSESFSLPGIDALELPLETIPQKRMDKLYATHPELRLHGGRLIDKSISQNLTMAPLKMQRSFAGQAVKIIERAKANGFSTVSLDLGLESALGDPELRQKALELIRLLAPALLKSNLVLELPCRVPSLVAPGWPAQLALFIKDCMVPGVKASLEVHPHELQPDFQPQALIRGLEFDVSSVILMYNVDSGNRIVKAHLEPWAALLARFGFYGPYLLCPKSNDRSRLPAECVSLANLLSSIRKEAASAVC